MSAILAQTINLLGALLLMLAFAMIAQRRILSLINLFTLQGLALVVSTGFQTNLATLPGTWQTGSTFVNSPLSAHAQR